MSQAEAIRVAQLQRDVNALRQEIQEVMRRLDALTKRRGPGRPRKEAA